MKQNVQLSDEMKRDLMKVYREESESYGGYVQAEIYKRTVAHPAPRFYVHAKSAHRYISPMLRGDRSKVERLKPLQRQMYDALFDVVVNFSRKEKFWNKSLYYILRQAVMEPAPRFFIGPMRMGQIWREQRGKERLKRKEQEKRYRIITPQSLRHEA